MNPDKDLDGPLFVIVGGLFLATLYALAYGVPWGKALAAIAAMAS